MNPVVQARPPAAAPAGRQPDFSRVTERPGQRASRLQLHMLKARYGWAARQAQGRDVLEAACGAGMGLALLAGVARSVAAGDLDPANLAAAEATYKDDPHIALGAFDALQLPYPAASFDLVLLFESLYYVPSAARFLAEAWRVLRPGGRLLLTQVNPAWSGFHPSPFSVGYLAAGQLQGALREAGFAAEIEAAFPERPGARDRLVAGIRAVAVKLGLMPRTMQGKWLLKRLFYGRLERVPARLGAGAVQPEQLTPVAACEDLSAFRVLYATGRKPH